MKNYEDYFWYTKEHEEWIRLRHTEMKYSDLHKVFCEHFDCNVSLSSFKNYITRKNIGTKNHRFKKEEIEFVREIMAEGKTWKEAAQLFNEKYGCNVTEDKVMWMGRRNGIRSTRDSTFKKGSVPFNKGLKADTYLSEEAKEKIARTQFKVGIKPPTYRPIGSTSIVDGQVIVKVGDPNEWMTRARKVWLDNHPNDEIKEDEIIYHINGDSLDDRVENLIKIDKSILCYINRCYAYHDDKYDMTDEEVRKSVIAVSMLKRKMTLLERRIKEDD